MYNEKRVFWFGVAFFITDLAFCVYSFMMLERVHTSYSGFLETTISLVRALLMMKVTRVFHYYWTAVIFPVTGFGILATSIFVTIAINILMKVLRNLRNFSFSIGEEIISGIPYCI